MKMNVEFKGLYHKTPHLFHQIKILMEVLLMTWTRYYLNVIQLMCLTTLRPTSPLQAQWKTFPY